MASGERSALTVQEQMELLLSEGRKVPVRTAGLAPPQLPPWYDPELYRKGQQFFARNLFVMFTAKLSGLLVLLAIPSVLRVLIHTRRSSTAMTAFRRYLSTLSHMIEWYSADADGDLANPNSRAYKSLAEVRGRHCAAARSAGQISQYDMAVTQFGFIGFALLRPHKLGISGGGEEGLVHFWRVIGYMMGMEDRFNLCRPEGVEETRELLSMVLEQEFIPNLKKPPDGFAYMSRALLEGVWAITPVIDCDAFTAFALTEMAGLPYDTRGFAWGSRFAFDLQKFVQGQLLMSSWFAWLLRPIFNFLMWFSIFSTQKSQFLANLTLTDNVVVVQQNARLAS